MIKSSVNRRKDSLQVVVEIPLGELLAHLGPRADQFRSRLRHYFAQLEDDVMEVGDIIANEAGSELGTVKFFNESEGWGFIRSVTREDVFVHFRGIVGDGYKTLKKGQRVRFKRRVAQEKVEAIDVVPVEGQE